MDINEFMDTFASVFDETPRDQLVPDRNFRDIAEWSSLVALSVIAVVDEEYAVTLTGDDIKGSNTIRDLYEKVVSKKG